MIQFFHVYKQYRDQPALIDVSLDVEKGEFVFLTGPSGAGKTTLLKLIFCAERTQRGQILVNGRNIARIRESAIPYLRRNIGVVFQDFKLLTAAVGLRERRPHASSAGPLQQGDPAQGARRCSRRSGSSTRPSSAAAPLGRRAAARGHRPGAGERSGHPPGRRADRQPRPRHDPRDHEPARRRQRARHHGAGSDPRPGAARALPEAHAHPQGGPRLRGRSHFARRRAEAEGRSSRGEDR